MADPLVLTALLEPAAQQHFDGLRRRHFPPERNQLAAHVTLFHALPGAELSTVQADLRAVDGEHAVTVVGLRSLGRGVAYELSSPGLAAVREELRRRWSPWLTRQDSQGWRPHVTVQNKVEPAAAAQLLAELSTGFVPWTTRSVGLRLWWYRGGPWEPVDGQSRTRLR